MANFVNTLIIELLKNPLFWILLVLGILTTIYYKKCRGFMGDLLDVQIIQGVSTQIR